jgi:hypothetical protein
MRKECKLDGMKFISKTVTYNMRKLLTQIYHKGIVVQQSMFLYD